MSWTVIIPKNVEAEIDKIVDDALRNDILNKIDSMKQDPYRHLSKMRKYPYYRFRVKHYRGIVLLANRKLVVNVLRIMKRNIVYRNLDKL